MGLEEDIARLPDIDMFGIRNSARNRRRNLKIADIAEIWIYIGMEDKNFVKMTKMGCDTIKKLYYVIGKHSRYDTIKKIYVIDAVGVKRDFRAQTKYKELEKIHYRDIKTLSFLDGTAPQVGSFCGYKSLLLKEKLESFLS